MNRVETFLLGFVVMISVACLFGCTEETTSVDKSGPSQVEVAENADRARVLDLTAEGASVLTEIQSDAYAGQDAMAAGDFVTACRYVGQLRPKLDRLSEIVDELDSMAMVHQVAEDDLDSLRTAESGMQANLTSVEAYC
jgi:hypothetical protein